MLAAAVSVLGSELWLGLTYLTVLEPLSFVWPSKTPTHVEQSVFVLVDPVGLVIALFKQLSGLANFREALSPLREFSRTLPQKVTHESWKTTFLKVVPEG